MLSDVITPRLLLRPLPAELLQACLAGDTQQAATLLGTEITADFLAEQGLITQRLKDIQYQASYAPWGLRAILRRADGVMLGYTNFQSLPYPAYLLGYGDIELGYHIAAAFRRCGYAREAVLGMAAWAVQQAQVQRFVLSIAPENMASLALAASLGFEQVGQVSDGEAVEWIFAAEWPFKATIKMP